jgi:HD-GYP domain-containing protein (c-di-GMP phosphodiesterase class II)
MISERPYRKAMSVETACAEIQRGKGTQFDPVIVEALLKSIKAAGFAARQTFNHR